MPLEFDDVVHSTEDDDGGPRVSTFASRQPPDPIPRVQADERASFDPKRRDDQTPLFADIGFFVGFDAKHPTVDELGLEVEGARGTARSEKHRLRRAVEFGHSPAPDGFDAPLHHGRQGGSPQEERVEGKVPGRVDPPGASDLGENDRFEGEAGQHGVV